MSLDAHNEATDAARYRWLRNSALQYLVAGPICIDADKWGAVKQENGMPVTLDGKQLDDAIDAAMRP